MKRFFQPTKLFMGAGESLKIGQILKENHKHVLLVSTDDAVLESLYERIISNLEENDVKVTHFKGVKPNPTVTSIDEALKLFDSSKFDAILAVGGGSSMDSAKAIALKDAHRDVSWEALFEKYDSPWKEHESLEDILPLYALPTTSGTGSQVTQAAVLSNKEDKLTLFHDDLFMKCAILDPHLTSTLPPRLTSATAFDAFTHAFESFISHRATPFSKNQSLKAMSLIIETLPKVLQEPDNLDYRFSLMVADTLGGSALSNAGAHIPHPLSEIVGGISNGAHGELLAAVYPAFIKHQEEVFKDDFEIIAKLFDENASYKDLYQHVVDFLNRIHCRFSLKDFVDDHDFEKVLNHPVLKVLPFGDEALLKTILKEAYA